MQLHALLEGAVPSVLLSEGAANWHLLSKHPCSYATAERKTIPCRPNNSDSHLWITHACSTTMIKPFKTEGSFAYDMSAGCSSATVGGLYIHANVDISAPDTSNICKTYQHIGHSQETGAVLQT